MRRPFALWGAAAFTALILAALLGADRVPALAWALAALGLCALLAAGAGRFSKKLSSRRGWRAFSVGAVCAAVALWTAAGCLGLFLWRWQTQVAPAQELAGQRARVRAVALDFPTQAYHRNYYLLRVSRVQVDGEDIPLPAFTARISAGVPLDCQPYDTVECTLRFSAFDASGGLYATRNARLADGVVLGGYLADYQDWTVLPNRDLPLGKLAALSRRRIARSFQRLLPGDEAGLIRAMLLGERDQAPDSALLDYRDIGSSHLLVISGLHMTAVAGLFLLLAGKLPLRRRGRNLLTIFGVFCYLALIGFPASATRAGIMTSLVLLAGLAGRRADGVNSLGAAVWLICLCQPFAGGDLGFALSVLGTLGVLTLSRPLADGLLWPFRRRPGLRRAMGVPANALAVTFSAQLCALPAQIAVFQGMSLLTPLAGLLLAAPCALLLYAALLAAALGLVPFLAPLAMAAAWAAGVMARLSLDIAALLARFPGFFLDFSRPGPLLAVGFSLLLAALGVAFRRERAVVSAVAAGVAALWVCWRGMALWAGREIVTLAALPDSSCVVAVRQGNAAVLCLGGYRTGAAERLLRRWNVRRVEALFLPLRDQDAREAAAGILSRFPVDRVVLPEGAFVGRDLPLDKAGASLQTLEEGERLELLGAMEVAAGEDFARLTTEVYGVTAIVEAAGSGPGACQLLFTGQGDTQIQSALCILLDRAIIEEEGPGWGDLPAGNYLLPAGNGVAFEILPDGTVRARGETDG